MNWYIEVLRKYAVFEGRARRTEFWMFVLFNIIIGAVLGIIDTILGLRISHNGAGVLGSLYSLGVLVPSLAVAVRRLHDTNRSGWWLFIGLIPLIGFIVLIVWYATEGTRGPNQYGSDPKMASAPGAMAPRPIAAGQPAGWYPDPSGRHQLRYWDSGAWTDTVSDDGVTSADPV